MTQCTAIPVCGKGIQRDADPDALGCTSHRGFLGWMHNVRGTPLEELSLRDAIPTAEREGVALAFEYIQWLLAERQISVRTEGLVIRSIMAAAKHVHHDSSQVTQLLPPARWLVTSHEHVEPRQNAMKTQDVRQ